MTDAAETLPSAIPLVAGRLRNTKRFVYDPLPFLASLTARYGDVFGLRLLNGVQVVLTNPVHINYVLQERMTNFVRETDAHTAVRAFLGNGLASIADHTQWRRNRRLAQPAFHRRQLELLGHVMEEAISACATEWAQLARDGKTVDLAEHMSHLTLRIVARAMFGLDPRDPALITFAAAAESANIELAHFVRMPFIPLKVPTPGHGRFWRALKAMDGVVYTVIERQRAGSGGGGLLAMLMEATDADTGAKLTDLELRDELVTMLFAGHETSAATLTWAWLLLQRHPQILARVRAEAESLPAAPAFADLPKLAYTGQVLQEVLRLYPPAWNLARSAHGRPDWRIPHTGWHSAHPCDLPRTPPSGLLAGPGKV